MGADTKIEWANHTFNPWIGCTAVSPACDHCYAEVSTPARALGVKWGAHERHRTSEANWRQPLAWNRKAERDDRRAKVFCASLADVFDNQVPPEWRRDLWALIGACENLDWLLLTKRPQNIAKMLPEPWLLTPMRNVWLGTTVENQAEASRRIPQLLAVPAAKRFLSCEPMLEPVDLSRCGIHYTGSGPLHLWKTDLPGDGGWRRQSGQPKPEIDWVICGGESGPHARPMNPKWARSLRDQCAAAGVPFLFKQWGEWVHAHPRPSETPGRFALAPREWDGPITQIDHYPRQFTSFGSSVLEHVGKKAAGRLLDGVEHNEVPA
ncbi:MAG: hypothetical protein JWR10_3406 [Rubritepida sp.]|nr:hypothetical protein [Rubritepida sp.]